MKSRNWILGFSKIRSYLRKSLNWILGFSKIRSYDLSLGILQDKIFQDKIARQEIPELDSEILQDNIFWIVGFSQDKSYLDLQGFIKRLVHWIVAVQNACMLYPNAIIFWRTLMQCIIMEVYTQLDKFWWAHTRCLITASARTCIIWHAWLGRHAICNGSCSPPAASHLATSLASRRVAGRETS